MPHTRVLAHSDLLSCTAGQSSATLYWNLQRPMSPLTYHTQMRCLFNTISILNQQRCSGQATSQLMPLISDSSSKTMSYFGTRLKTRLFSQAYDHVIHRHASSASEATHLPHFEVITTRTKKMTLILIVTTHAACLLVSFVRCARLSVISEKFKSNVYRYYYNRSQSCWAADMSLIVASAVTTGLS